MNGGFAFAAAYSGGDVQPCRSGRRGACAQHVHACQDAACAFAAGAGHGASVGGIARLVAAGGSGRRIQTRQRLPEERGDPLGASRLPRTFEIAEHRSGGTNLD